MLAVCAVTVIVSGCGGGSSGAGPLDNALGYLPEDAPLVVTLDTDVEGKQFAAMEEIVEEMPFGDRIQDEIEDRLEDGNVSYRDDVKPLLGNEVVVGATDVRALAEGSGSSDAQDFVAAIQVKDKDKLEKLLEKEADQDGEVDGAKIYEDGSDDVFALDDDVLVAASSRSDLEDALEQRGQDDRLTEDEFEKSVEGLPKEALVKVGGNLRELIAADPDSREAREVPWVAALRTFGAAVSVKGEQAELDFKVATDGGELSDEDIPLASGDQSPPALALPGEIGLGLRDPAQLVRFAEQAAQAADPGDYARFQTARRALERRLDIDFEDDVLDQMEDEVALSVSPRGDVSARVELEDEAAFRTTLRKIERTFPRSSSLSYRPRFRCRRVRIPGSSRTRLRCTTRPGSTRYVPPTGPRLTRFGDTTVIRMADGDSVAYSIEDGALLISNQLFRVSQLRREEPEDVPGARGSVSMKADAGPLVLAVLRSSGLYYRLGGSGLGSGLGSSSLGSQSITGSLDDLTGWMRTSKKGLVGKVRLTVD